MENDKKAYFSLPGLFEFYDFYKVFLPFYFENRSYFYEDFIIGSIYGSPERCIFNGGRESVGYAKIDDVINLMNKYNIESRLTFSNSLIEERHLSDRRCNEVLKRFSNGHNGVIIYSDLLLDCIKKKYPNYYFISSTTKVLTDRYDLINELNRRDFKYVVPDFRFNNNFEFLVSLNENQKEKIEFLCNECCPIGCYKRKECYKAVSEINMGLNPNHECAALERSEGYSFSKAMESKAFIGIDDIKNKYLPLGYGNFKIEGRSLGSALLLEFILYYLTKPEYVLKVREKIYLTNTLDLF